VERLLARAQVRPEPGEGLEELSERLRSAAHPLATPLSAVTRRYLEARFGGRPLRPGERAELLERMRQSVRRLPQREPFETRRT
jgi:hypothetical protein